MFSLIMRQYVTPTKLNESNVSDYYCTVARTHFSVLRQRPTLGHDAISEKAISEPNDRLRDGHVTTSNSDEKCIDCVLYLIIFLPLSPPLFTSLFSAKAFEEEVNGLNTPPLGFPHRPPLILRDGEFLAQTYILFII